MAIVIYRTDAAPKGKDNTIQETLASIKQACSPEDALMDFMIYTSILIHNLPDMKALLTELQKEDSDIFKEVRNWESNEVGNILKVVKAGGPADLDYLASILEYKIALSLFRGQEAEYFKHNPSSTLDHAMMDSRFAHDPEFQLLLAEAKLKAIKDSDPDSHAYSASILKYQEAIGKFKEAERKYFAEHPSSTLDRSMISGQCGYGLELQLFLESLKKE